MTQTTVRFLLATFGVDAAYQRNVQLADETRTISDDGEWNWDLGRWEDRRTRPFARQR